MSGDNLQESVLHFFCECVWGGSEDNLRESLLHLRMIPGNQTEVIKLGNSTFIC